MTDPIKALFDFETAADKQIAAISIAAVPARAIWAHYHFLIFVLYYILGARDPSKRRSAEATAYRLSYILNWIAKRSSDGETMRSASADALFRQTDPGALGAGALDAYAHFSEVLPDVRRDRLSVRRIQGGFRIQHHSRESAREDAADILISALAMPHIANRISQNISSAVKAIAQRIPTDWTSVVAESANRLAKYHSDVREDPVVSDAAMTAIFGFSGPRFREIQAATFALAEVCQELALTTYMNTADANGDPSDETLEHVSISRPEAEIVSWLFQLAGGHQGDVETFVDTFTFDATAKKLRGGEGYTPPFVRIGTQLCFSPDLVFRFVQPRNAIQDLMRLDKKKFDNLVSSTLEPTLVDAVLNELSAFPNTKYATSVKYDRRGEIDLMIVDPSSGDVVIIEVKGPLPPQGSRGTERLAGRVREGVSQLVRFQNLTKQEKLQIVESGTNLRLAEAKFHYVVMARACLGACELWSPSSPITPATLPLVRLALQSMQKRRANIAADLANEIKTITAEIMYQSKWHWSSGKMMLFGKKIFTPQLRYNEAVVDVWRRRAAGEAL